MNIIGTAGVFIFIVFLGLFFVVLSNHFGEESEGTSLFMPWSTCPNPDRRHYDSMKSAEQAAFDKFKRQKGKWRAYLCVCGKHHIAKRGWQIVDTEGVLRVA